MKQCNDTIRRAVFSRLLDYNVHVMGELVNSVCDELNAEWTLNGVYDVSPRYSRKEVKETLYYMIVNADVTRLGNLVGLRKRHSVIAKANVLAILSGYKGDKVEVILFLLNSEFNYENNNKILSILHSLYIDAKLTYDVDSDGITYISARTKR